MQFTLTNPVIITPRLLPGVQIGKAFISIEYAGRSPDNRTIYRYYIDLPNRKSYIDNDLKSGCGGGSLHEGLSSLLSFLGACAESVAYQDRTGRASENANLFPDYIGQWAAMNSDELSMLSCELDESPDCIQENSTNPNTIIGR